ncbi:MAG: type II toxin-antitoxin system VapC family toxin [Solirubrobacteraceae bacterium]
MSPPPGRKPGSRGIYAIEDSALVLPPSVALDTSFIVKALVESETGHAACAAFVDRIRELGVTVVTSELVAVELAEAVVQIVLKERWGRQWRQHRDDGRTRRRSRRPLSSTLRRYELILSSLPHISIPLGDVAEQAAELMVDYGLASYDAVHAATAIAAGAEAIVTIDTGFALLPSRMLAIYTDRSRVPSCRAKRPA